MVARNKLMNKISDFQYAIGVTLASDDGNHIQADTQFGFVCLYLGSLISRGTC